MITGATRAVVLLVEDDEAYRYAAASALRADGFEVFAFADYRGALEMIEGGQRVALMIADVRLPASTPHGFSLALMARVRNPSLPVLFVTGFDEYIGHEMAAGLGKVLRKPVENAVLCAEARAAIAASAGSPGC